MKKLLTFLFVLFIASFSQAQWVIENFDSAVGTFFPDPPVRDQNFFANGATAEFLLSDNADAFEGSGSLKMDYRIEASDGWGGYIVRTTYIPGTVPNEPPYIDLSTGTHLKLRYKVLSPAVLSKDGTVFMEFKCADFGEAGTGRDMWLHHTAIDFLDASGQWIEISMPLEFNSDNTLGFSNQFAEGDGVLQWDKIKGFEIALVYITQGGAPAPTAIGSVLIDKLELVGNRYNPFTTFDDAVNDFAFDDMSWAGAGKSTVNLSNNNSDFVEGTGSMQLDYIVNASQNWGGYLNIRDTTFILPSDFNERTALVIWIKNVNPIVGSTPKRVTMRFFLMENSTGQNEDWIAEVPVDFETAGDWQRFYIPLKMDSIWTDENGKQRFPQNGLAQPWWSITGDQTFNPDAVTGWKIELSAGGDDYGPVGETFAGTLLFDVVQPSGFQFADKTAPAAPVVNVIPSAYSNLVTWLDVPGESGEKYFVYYSESPISDINGPEVSLAFTDEPIPHGVQVYEHALRSANEDKSKTYYYAITCRDFAGNVSEPAFFGPVNNTARGVPTVSVTPPVSFVADGNLNEWSSAQPSFLMQSALGTANVVLNVDNDNDCSAEVKVAIDDTYLYVMMDVTDDFVHWNDAIPSYENDAPDLFIGLYDMKKTHVAYWRGETPDYHLRFGKFWVRSDESNSQCDTMIANGTANYYYGEKFPSGYIVEAKIPLVDLAQKRNPNIVSTDVINWKIGDKIPFDIGINDNDDGLVRQGMIFYSPTNKDRGWQNVASWTYTWISDDVTGVNDNPAAVNSFNLAQNYPNPFNPSTQIQYSIAEAGLVSIRVFDILGREVAELVNQNQNAGTYTVDFNGQNLSSGVYIYKIESGSFTATKKMMLMK